MQKKSNKRVKRKYSTFNPSPKLLKTLKNIFAMNGGTVSYVFCEERITFEDEKFPNGKYITVKTSLSCPINPKILYKEVRGILMKRTPQEILKVFEDTKHDLGASYFIIG